MPKARILVVDDERIVSLDIQGALLRLGYEIAGVAATGEDALALAVRAQPDLVLMDIHLAGGMDGTEAAAEISKTHSIPVVFLTAYSDEDTMQRALAAAPFGYLLKPFEDRDLRSGIELALAKHAAVRELHRARRSAEEADRAKTAFLATLSHELRTPMNGILGMAELLLMSGLDDDQREALEHMKNAAQSFTNILNRLLEFSTLEGGVCELTQTEFAVADFLESATAGHRAQAEAKGLAFELELGPLPERLLGAADRVGQVLGHLLDNALAHTTTGCVHVEALADPEAPQDGDPDVFHLLLRVRDTGCGIPETQLGTIFESFTQGESYLTRQVPGLGLGLAVCKRLAERLGGRVCASSKTGEGSQFDFCVPLRRCAAPDVPSVGLDGVRVLVVEDDHVNSIFVQKGLTHAGCVVRLASSGEQALEILAVNSVDIVVMDLQLRGVDGLAVTRALRSGACGCGTATPVVALTAFARDEDRARCLAAGMDGVLVKPAKMAELKDLLRAVLARSQARRMPPRTAGGAQTSSGSAGDAKP